MSTRLYLLGSTRTGTTPAYSGSLWTSSGSAARSTLPEHRDPSGITLAKVVSDSSSSRQSLLYHQLASPRLEAQTISGTIKGQIRASVTNAAAAACLLMRARIVAFDGTERGVLYESTTAGAATSVSVTPGSDTYELSTTLTNRKLPAGWSGAGAALSSVDAQEGDRLVVELGIRFTNTSSTTYQGTLQLGSASLTTDLAEDESSTSDHWPWIELSGDLAFVDEPTRDASQRALWIGDGDPVPTLGQLWPRSR